MATTRNGASASHGVQRGRVGVVFLIERIDCERVQIARHLGGQSQMIAQHHLRLRIFGMDRTHCCAQPRIGLWCCVVAQISAIVEQETAVPLVPQRVDRLANEPGRVCRSRGRKATHLQMSKPGRMRRQIGGRHFCLSGIDDHHVERLQLFDRQVMPVEKCDIRRCRRRDGNSRDGIPAMRPGQGEQPEQQRKYATAQVPAQNAAPVPLKKAACSSRAWSTQLSCLFPHLLLWVPIYKNSPTPVRPCYSLDELPFFF
jgi:hypothetical protein